MGVAAGVEEFLIVVAGGQTSVPRAASPFKATVDRCIVVAPRLSGPLDSGNAPRSAGEEGTTSGMHS